MSDIVIGSDVEKLKIGLSWDPNEQKAGVLDDSIKVHNLDLSCVIFSDGDDVLDVLTPQEPKRDHYQHQIFHLGDHLSGGSDFEDEAIQINLDALDPQIGCLAFVVSVQGRVKFSEVRNGQCEILNGITLESLMAVDFQSIEKPAMVAFTLKRNGAGFTLAEVKKPIAALDADLVQRTLLEL